jgi:hypothetical protein
MVEIALDTGGKWYKMLDGVRYFLAKRPIRVRNTLQVIVLWDETLRCMR